MIVLSGTELKKEKFIDLKQRVEKIKQHGILPKLAVVLAGNDPASEVYVGHKNRSCEQLGIISQTIRLPDNVQYEDVEKVVHELALDESVHGILVQFPLPNNISKRRISRLIPDEKDVDGMSPRNNGIHFSRHWKYAPKPCTPYGIMEILNRYNIPVKGKLVTIVGRSNIVGRPLSYLMNNEGATVTMVHTQTPKNVYDILTQNADILVAAAGRPHMIKAENIKDGAVLIDVGIHRMENNKLTGDVDLESVKDKAYAATPVPGGVGPMTIAMLMENLVRLIEVLHIEKSWNHQIKTWW